MKDGLDTHDDETLDAERSLEDAQSAQNNASPFDTPGDGGVRRILSKDDTSRNDDARKGDVSRKDDAREKHRATSTESSSDEGAASHHDKSARARNDVEGARHARRSDKRSRSVAQQAADPEAAAVFGRTVCVQKPPMGRANTRRAREAALAASEDAAYRPTVPPAQSRRSINIKAERTLVPWLPALVALGIIILIFAIIYGAGVYVFSERFYPNTFVGAVDLSLVTQDEAVTAVAQAESDYEILVEGQGLSFTVSADDGGISVDAKEVVAQVVADIDPWLWFMEIWGEHDKTSYLVASSDEGTLGDYVRAQVEAFNETATPSEDAYVSYSINAGAFVVRSEVYGTQVSADAVVEAVATAIATMESTVAVTEDMLITPEVLVGDERLTEVAETANTLAQVDITITAPSLDVELAVLDGSTLIDWIVVDGFEVSLDEEALSTWLEDLSSTLNTVGTTRTYTRGDGTTVTAEGGNYGWEVDAEALEAAVIEAVYAGVQGEVEVEFSTTGNGYTKEGMDWGAYLDVDMTEQHAYYYDAEGNLLWDSGIVTGLAGEYDTPTGIYYLNSKQTNVTLIGLPDENGDPSYETDVDYWMPFVNNMVGLHDASWQPSWVFSDATAYKTYGSHGCINLPASAAAELYTIIQIGDPVIVHE